MLFPARVGQVWEGEFTGRTVNRGTSASSADEGEDYTGTYTVRMAGDEHWTIGGTRVRVLGYEFDVVLEGEFNGTVSVDYWFAPRYGLTVREEYWADAKVGPLDYYGHWFVKLRSLTPRT